MLYSPCHFKNRQFTVLFPQIKLVEARMDYDVRVTQNKQIDMEVPNFSTFISRKPDRTRKLYKQRA